MAFRNKSHYPLSPAVPEVTNSFDSVDGVNYTSRRVIGFKPLPPAENYSLDKVIAAGLPLEKVSTVILPSRVTESMLTEQSSVKESESEQTNK